MAIVNAGVPNARWVSLAPFSMMPTWLAFGSQVFAYVSNSISTLSAMPSMLGGLPLSLPYPSAPPARPIAAAPARLFCRMNETPSAPPALGDI